MMPIKECTDKNGKKGWKWGNNGVCYPTKKEAEDQMKAAYAAGYTGDMMALDSESSKRTVTADGELQVRDCPITSEGVCGYYGREISGYQSLGLQADKLYQLYRPASELEKALPTFEAARLLARHEGDPAFDAQKALVVGAVGGVRLENGKIIGTVSVWDKNAIAGIESGRCRELSAGYHWVPDMTPGTFDGQPYDGIITEIKANHVALVETGRVSGAMIMDQGVNKLKTKGKFNPKTPLGYAVYGALMGLDAMPEDMPQSAETAGKDWAKEKADIIKALKEKAPEGTDIDAVIAELDKLDDMAKAMAKDEDSPIDAAIAALSQLVPDADMSKVREVLAEAAQDDGDFLLDVEQLALIVADILGHIAHESGETPEQEAAERKMAQDSAPKRAAVRRQQRVDIGEIVASVREQSAAVEQAKSAVAPVVGTLALDSATADPSDVYKAALDVMGVDVAGVDPSAYEKIFNVCRNSTPAQRQLAMDSSAEKSLREKVPGLFR